MGGRSNSSALAHGLPPTLFWEVEVPARDFALIGHETLFFPNLPSSLFGHNDQERWSPRWHLLPGGVFPATEHPPALKNVPAHAPPGT